VVLTWELEGLVSSPFSSLMPFYKLATGNFFQYFHVLSLSSTKGNFTENQELQDLLT